MFNIYGGDRNNDNATYPSAACLISKINRLLISDEFRWVSDELNIQLLPADPTCLVSGGALSFNTHRFDPSFTADDDCDAADWGFAQSSQYKWTKQAWYYVVVTWSEEAGMTISVNLQQDPIYGSDPTALEMPEDGLMSNFLIGNYWDRYKTNRGIDALFAEMRVSSKIRTVVEQAYVFNAGNGRRLEPDAYTLGLWHFDEGEGTYGFNAYRRQTTNLPIFGVPGAVKKGYIYQPDDQTSSGESSEGLSSPGSSGEITYAAEFVRDDSQYLNCGRESYLNMQSFGGDVSYRFASAFIVKRRSTGSRQAVVSKWKEDGGKQFWVGFNDQDQIEVRLGKGASVDIERTTELISNPYDYAEVTGSGIRDFDGVYVGQEGYTILTSSNAEESSESSWGPHGSIQVEDCAIDALNGWYDFYAVENNDGVPVYGYPYVEMADAGMPAANGIYATLADWDTARVIYEDPALPFPNIKVEGAQRYTEGGIPIPDEPEGSSSQGESSDSSAESSPVIDFNGVYVPEQYWSVAKDAILGPGAPDPSAYLTWESGGQGVWRKVATDRDYTMFHAGDSWDGWILGLNANFNDSFYYSFKLRHEQPPITWTTLPYLGTSDPGIRAYRSEEFYSTGLIQITRWAGAGQPIWRHTRNPDLELYVDTSADGYEQWVLGIFEAVDQINLYWAPFSDEEFPLSFYVGNAGEDPGPQSRIYNYPALQGGSGRTIWRHRDNPEFYIYRDRSPWEPDWSGWFMGRGTDHQENYFFAEWNPGQTDIIPPSQWFLDYYGQGETPIVTPYPLVWEIDGQPIFRQVDNPSYCIYRNIHPDSYWFGWFLGKGYDAVNAMWWSDDNQPFIPPTWYVMTDPDADPPSTEHFYAQYLPAAERPDPDNTPVADSHPKNAELSVLQRVINREAGVDEFGAVAADTITDTDRFHQVVVSWSKHCFNGAVRIFVDGNEVSAYEQQDSYRGDMPFLAGNGDVAEWAPMNIGRTFDIGGSSSSIEGESSQQEESSSDNGFIPVPPEPVGNPDDYLDAVLDEVTLFSSRLIDVEVQKLWNHLREGAQDGDRWYIDDPDLRIVTGSDLIDEYGDLRGDRLSDPATGEWTGYKEYFADWRRDAVTGEYGWYFHPVEYAGVFWNNDAGRLDSWLPDEYYELWGDYGVTGTGDFKIG
jgi:hypothetical protein